MAYDHSGKHSAFDGATNDGRRVLEAGVSPKKLILGFPFYGRAPIHRERTMFYRDILTKCKIPSR